RLLDPRPRAAPRPVPAAHLVVRRRLAAARPGDDRDRPRPRRAGGGPPQLGRPHPRVAGRRLVERGRATRPGRAHRRPRPAPQRRRHRRVRRRPRPPPPHPRPSLEPPIIDATHLTKSYGRHRALARLDLTARPGVTGLLGPNGAGKTTLLRILATVIAPDGGRLRLLGRDPADGEQRLEVRRRLGYLPQDAGFHGGFTAFEAVDYVAVLKEHAAARARHDEVRRVLDHVGLGDVTGRKVRALSGG